MANKENVKKHIFDCIDEILEKRKTADPEKSYTAKLLNEGISFLHGAHQVAQKLSIMILPLLLDRSIS